jgi:hypothetical protein
MRSATRLLTFNAICLYIAAYLLTVMLHEVGHATMSWVLGGQPILYNTSVQNANKALSDMARVQIAAAGPVLSLLQGALLLAVVRRCRMEGTWGLFWLYMGVFGMVNFLGYVMIAPLVTGGDTGQIVALLHVPAWVQWPTAVLALLLLMQTIGGTAPLFARLLPAGLLANKEAQTQAMRSLIAWPWLVGSIVLVLLALPAPHPAVVANMFMSPMVLRRTYRNALNLAAPEASTTDGLLLQQWLPLVAVVALAVVFKLLSRGIAW